MERNDKYARIYQNAPLTDKQVIEVQQTEIERIKADLAAYRALGTPDEIRARLEKCVPCIAGTTIFYVADYDKEFEIEEGYLSAISQDSDDAQNNVWWFRGIYKSGLTFWHTNDYLFRDVFFTREAAETRLRELGAK